MNINRLNIAFIVVFCVLMHLWGVLSAEVIQYEFPSLAGDYPPNLKRESVAYDGAPGEVIGVTCHLVGVGYTGLMECYFCEECPPDTVSAGLIVNGSFKKVGEYSGWYEGYHCSGTVDSFDVEFPLEMRPSQYPYVLEPGDTLRFSVDMPGYAPGPTCIIIEEQWVTLTGVRFLIDLRTTVESSNSTWGAIKTLYEDNR
jgi:hypothetical protein